MRRLLIVSDAWEPQINGVVTTLKAVIPHLEGVGLEVQVVHPGLFPTLPLPGYPEIRLARSRPDAVHIATEGPLGLWARRLLRRGGVPFSTSLHTKVLEYVNERTRLPLSVGYRFLRWFRRPATVVLCAAESHRRELERRGMRNLVVWGRGVDAQLFRPMPRVGGPRPRLLYVGRVAIEKNLDAFLGLDVDADKIIVGDGPSRAELQHRFPGAIWRGYKRGEALAAEYAQADAFVFPSRTDTFGLVMLEAMACGTPVAAYPVTGPRDVVEPGMTGSLHEDLGQAVREALVLDRERCRIHAMRHDWRQVTERMARCPR